MGNRLKQVSLNEACPEIREIYRQFFGERDPVAQPGTATGTPGDYWTTYALVPHIQARLLARAIAEGGAYLNNVKVTEQDAVPAESDLLHGRYLILRRGKRTVGAVEVVPEGN